MLGSSLPLALGIPLVLVEHQAPAPFVVELRPVRGLIRAPAMVLDAHLILTPVGPPGMGTRVPFGVSMDTYAVHIPEVDRPESALAFLP